MFYTVFPPIFVFVCEIKKGQFSGDKFYFSTKNLKKKYKYSFKYTKNIKQADLFLEEKSGVHQVGTFQGYWDDSMFEILNSSVCDFYSPMRTIEQVKNKKIEYFFLELDVGLE